MLNLFKIFFLFFIFCRESILCDNNSFTNPDEACDRVNHVNNTETEIVLQIDTEETQPEEMIGIKCFNDLASLVIEKPFEFNSPTKIATLSIGLLSTTFLFFLGRDFVQKLCGVDILSYGVGIISLIPVAIMTTEFIEEDLLAYFYPNFLCWKEIEKKRNYCSFDFQKEFFSYVVRGAFSLVGSAIGIYYTWKYWSEIIWNYSYFFIAPTIIGQVALSDGALRKTGGYLIEEIKNNLFKNCLSEKIRKKDELRLSLKKLKKQILRSEDQKIEEIYNYILNGDLTGILKIEQVNRSSDYAGNSYTQRVFGYTGTLIGFIGSYTIIQATETSVSWIFSSLGIEGDENYWGSKICGYMGGITIGALRAFGLRGSFDKIFSGLQSMRGSHESRQVKLTKRALIDFSSLILSSIALAPRIQIILDTNVVNPFFRYTIIACQIISAIAKDFYSYRILIDSLSKKQSFKSKTINMIDFLENKIDNISENYINDIYNEINSQN